MNEVLVSTDDANWPSLLITVFVLSQSRMTLTGSTTSPFAAIEAALYKTLFAGCSPYAALTAEETKGGADRSASGAARGSGTNGAAGMAGPAPPVKGQTPKEAKEESGKREAESCKKTE